MRVSDFPQELGAQGVKAKEIILDLFKRVMNRVEELSVTVRNGQRRYSKESMILVPPIEVFF